ncbi:MAG: hypothetical protein RR055_05115 [Oscillospiraceae bacterium]
MKKLWKFLLGLRFVAAVLLVFFAADLALSLWAPVENSDLFPRNDYEKTIAAHGGGTEYDRVIYGNSVLISSYIEGDSASGYVNFGLDYGTVTDLDKMLKRSLLKVDDELVIALNYFVLLDVMDTNPSYPWHRGALEPYVYFERDRLRKLADESFLALMHFRPLSSLPRYTGTDKAVYYGMMTDAELAEKAATHSELYWGLGTEYYSENLAALQSVIRYCADSDVRLRVIFCPWNSFLAMPENPAKAMELARALLEDAGVEVLDLTDALDRRCFHDLGHLNYEYGAVYFTEAIEQWLNS